MLMRVMGVFIVVLLAVGLSGDESVDTDISLWMPGSVRVKNLTQSGPDVNSLELFMDAAFDERTTSVVKEGQKFIDLEQVYTDSFNGTVWAFKTVIIIPPLSCGSVGKIASLFDDGLRRVNPDYGMVSSTAQRIGADMCVDNICPCLADDLLKHATRVLQIETRCGASRLALPSADDFPFAYDARTNMPPFHKKRGRILDGYLSSLVESVRLRLANVISINSSTLASSSALR